LRKAGLLLLQTVVQTARMQKATIRTEQWEEGAALPRYVAATMVSS